MSLLEDSTQSALDEISKRQHDNNGWYEIQDNPISKVGIFPYSGEQVGGEPGKLYNVYRPEEELSNPDTLNSFKLVPWINDHVMLGDSDIGLTPPEQKGIEGVIGENVYFKDGILFANIKVFSENLADLIESGKKQLSAGYRCVYELISGTWNGQHYDAIQRNIRGNHLALVQEGRMGPDVAVLDHFKFTFDTKELLKMPDLDKEKEDKEKIEAEGEDKIDGIKGIDESEAEKEKEKEAADKKAADEAEEEEKKKKEGMDASIALDAKFESFKKQILTEASAKEALAKKLSYYIGTFDSSDKTLSEVASYGVEKLGINCPKGSERIALDGFLHNREVKKTAFALDTSSKPGGKLDAFINSAKGA